MVKFKGIRGLLTAVVATTLGAAALTAAAPAQAQYRDGFGDRVERRIIERRVVRPVERRVIVRRPFVRDCRVVVTRRINRFGERVVVRRRICG